MAGGLGRRAPAERHEPPCSVHLVRLFVAAWPSRDVCDVIAALDRPEHPAVRWTAPDQWHVTLRFLGEVPEQELAALTAALRALADQPAVDVEVGPATQRLSRWVFVVPVTGLGALGDAVVDATRSFGEPPDDRPFAGHVTVARARRGRPIPAALAGQPVSASWRVRELALVRSTPASQGARYETLLTVPLVEPTSREEDR